MADEACESAHASAHLSTPTALTLVSFVSDTYRDALQDVVQGLRYDISVVQSEKWLLADPDMLARPTIIFLSRNDSLREKLLAALAKAAKVSLLGIFTSNEAGWDEKVLAHCDDFLGWPCHEDELALRLQRVFGGLESATSSVDEVDLLEEFVNFNMLGSSPAFLEALKIVKRFARCDVPVLIGGETGTGKELAARAIHYLGARRDYPFIPVNCGAIPDNLLENELFGHERGAFTDAKDRQLGIVTEAEGGTLFFDEVDTLSIKAQVALLRFLEDQKYKPLGCRGSKKANVRIVAATNTNLEELARKGQFRWDLLFRLNVLFVELPPLRKRGGDMKLLAEHFIRECRAHSDGPSKTLHPGTLSWMMHHDWNGNVRELENLIYRSYLLSEGPVIYIPKQGASGARADSLTDTTERSCVDMTFRDAKVAVVTNFERNYLRNLMAQTQGNISLAAKRAGKERSALRKLLRKHGVEKNEWSIAS